MISQPGRFFNPIRGGIVPISPVLANHPQLALALTQFAGYNKKVAKVRRVTAADEVDVYSFRDSDGFYQTDSGWEDASAETLYLVEWYSQSGTNYAYQTVQADQPLLSWSLSDGWYLYLQGSGRTSDSVGQFMYSNEVFSAQTVFCNFEVVGAGSLHFISGSSAAGSHGHLFIRGDTNYYMSVDGSAGNQGYIYRNNDAKLGPGGNLGTTESILANQIASIGMTTANDIDQDLLFAFTSAATGRPNMRCRCFLSYPAALDETTTRLDIHNLLMTQYGI